MSPAGLALLAPMALSAAMIMVPLAWGLQEIWPFGAAAVIVAWWLPAPLLWTRPGQRLLANRKGLRQPVGDESTRLAGPWASVQRRARIPDGEYHLVVSDVADVTAPVPGSGQVAVTSLAAVRLPPGEQEAVLAHELGHQLRMHNTTRALAFELLLPARVMSWVLPRLVRWVIFLLLWVIYLLRLISFLVRSTITFVASAFGVFGNIAVGLVGWASRIVAVIAIAFLLLLIWASFRSVGIKGILSIFHVPAVHVIYLVYVAIALLFTLAGMALRRLAADREEYEADMTAVRLGLGPELLTALESYLQVTRPAEERSGHAFRMRPLIVRRVERLRAALARAAR